MRDYVDQTSDDKLWKIRAIGSEKHNIDVYDTEASHSRLA
jgi:hypothetical protein